MKFHPASRVVVATLISLLPVCVYSAGIEGSKTAPGSPALSANDLTKISERMRQAGEQMRVDIKKARARFEAQEIQRKQEAERARQQAIKENAVRQAQKAAQAQAERERQEEQVKLQAERKKQLLLSAQTTKEDQAAQLQARKAKAAEALRKARASVGVKAFGE